MNRSRIEHLLQTFNPNPPASLHAVAETELRIGRQLPRDYIEFLVMANGGEGFIADNAYVIFWRIEDLAEMQNAYRVSTFAPGLLLIGSDGGGEAFAYDFRTESEPIVRVPFIGMELKLVESIAANFEEFLEYLAIYLP